MLRLRLATTLLFLMATSAPLLAHAMRASVSITENEVIVLVRFDGDDDLVGAVQVILEDTATKTKWAEGVADKSGECRFPRPAPGEYRIIAEDDGFGHRAERAFKVEENATYSEAAPVVSRADRTWQVVVGLSVIAALTLASYLWVGRTRNTGTNSAV